MTILGKHTLAETEELLGNVQNRVTDVKNTFDKLPPDVTLARDPTLPADWALWLGKWTQTAVDVKKKLGIAKVVTPGVPNSVIATEEQWNQILKATREGYPGPYTDKDLPGLQIRIGKIKPIEWKQVELNRVDADDADLKSYKKVDEVIKKGEDSVGEVIADNWGKIAIGAGVVFGGLWLYKKL